MKRINKKLPNTDYEGRFKKIRNGKVIKSKNGKRKIKFTKADDWRQCYSEDSETRKGYPKHWFINPNGELITMCYAEPHLLSYTMNSNGYIRYSTQTKQGGKYIRFFAHQMIAEIFGSYEYSNKNNDDTIIHHEKGKGNNTSITLEYVSPPIHAKLHHINSCNFDKQKIIASIGNGITEPTAIFTGISIKNKEDNGDRSIFKLKDINLSFKQHETLTRESAENIILDDIANGRIPKEDCLITVHEEEIQFAYIVTHDKYGNCKFSIIPVPTEQIFILKPNCNRKETEREDVKA